MGMTSKIGFGNSTDVSNALAAGILDERDLIVTKDTHEMIYIDDNKNQIVVKSRLKIFNNVNEANVTLNKDKTTYAGEPVIININNVYNMYIVQLNNDGLFYVQKISNETTIPSTNIPTTIDWENITNIPSSALNDKDTTYKLTQDVDKNTITLISSDNVKYTIDISYLKQDKNNLVNTTYKLVKEDNKIKLIDNDGATTEVVVNDTTYSLKLDNTNLIFTDNNGKETVIPLISFVNTNTTYSLVKKDNKIYLRDSNGADSAISIINNVATNENIGYVKIGENIDINDKGTISITKNNVRNALGYQPANIVYSSKEPQNQEIGDYWVK